MSKTITIPVVTRTQDNGDGGYTTYVYNNNDELIKDHPKSKSYAIIDGVHMNRDTFTVNKIENK